MSSAIPLVWLSTIMSAFSIWLLKNSPKFFIYILHFLASTTVTPAAMSISSTCSAASLTSLSLPTPDGSMIILSGLSSCATFLRACVKSPTRVQHMQPEFISVISMPESSRKPLSIPISPNSFSTITSFSPLYASSASFLISVVLPAPKNPENISVFIICNYLFLKLILKYYHIFGNLQIGCGINFVLCCRYNILPLSYIV